MNELEIFYVNIFNKTALINDKTSKPVRISLKGMKSSIYNRLSQKSKTIFSNIAEGNIV